MLDDHDAQALGAIAAMFASWYALRELAPDLTVEFAALLAFGGGLVGWWAVSEIKRHRRFTNYSTRPGRLARPVAVVAIVGVLAVFAVSAVYGTGVVAIDDRVDEMVGEDESIRLSVSNDVKTPSPDEQNPWDFPPPSTEPYNAWGKNPVKVFIHNPEDGYVDENSIRVALQYWNSNHEEYTPYNVNFTITDVENDADVVVVYTQDTEAFCGTRPHAGCANLIRPSTSVPKPAFVYLDSELYPKLNSEQRFDVATHEFGHILGLHHDDEPARIMATDR